MKNYDVIIIGAGPSGIFCAYELSSSLYAGSDAVSAGVIRMPFRIVDMGFQVFHSLCI